MCCVLYPINNADSVTCPSLVFFAEKTKKKNKKKNKKTTKQNMAAPKKKTSALSEKPEPKTGPLTNLSDDHTSILIEKYKGFYPL